jgi:hypothetical protein
MRKGEAAARSKSFLEAGCEVFSSDRLPGGGGLEIARPVPLDCPDLEYYVSVA